MINYGRLAQEVRPTVQPFSTTEHVSSYCITVGNFFLELAQRPVDLAFVLGTLTVRRDHEPSAIDWLPLTQNATQRFLAIMPSTPLLECEVGRLTTLWLQLRELMHAWDDSALTRVSGNCFDD